MMSDMEEKVIPLAKMETIMDGIMLIVTVEMVGIGIMKLSYNVRRDGAARRACVLKWDSCFADNHEKFYIMPWRET